MSIVMKNQEDVLRNNIDLFYDTIAPLLSPEKIQNIVKKYFQALRYYRSKEP